VNRRTTVVVRLAKSASLTTTKEEFEKLWKGIEKMEGSTE